MELRKETLQSIWKMNKEKLIFVFCSGLLLFVLSLPGDKDSFGVENAMQTGTNVGSSVENRYAGNGDGADEAVTAGGSNGVAAGISYEADLELRVREILTNVEDVGEVEVMVVLKSSEEKSIHTEFSEKSVYPELSGIVISADGGGSAVVKAEISEAMEALFGLPSHKIKVLKRVKKGV